MKKVLLLIVSIISFNVYACDCSEPTIIEAYDRAQDVFIGEVISVDESYYGKSGRQMTILYKVRVTNPFKTGIGKDNEVVTFYADIGGCEYNFIKGEKYLIYTDASDRTFAHTNTCLRTQILKLVKKSEIEELEALYKKINKQGNLDVFFPKTITITQKEYKALQKQGVNVQKKTKQNKYLIILCSFIFITAIVFFILYIKAIRQSES